MDSNQENKAELSIIKEDEIDLIALIKVIGKGRKTIFYSIGIAIFIGLVIGFSSPAKYKAYCILIPSEEKKGGNLGNLGALAGMAGINLGSMMGGASGIPAEIYPQVVNSYPFKKEIVHQKFHFEDFLEPISFFEYAVADTLESFGSKFKKYTIRLPWTIKSAFFDDNSNNVETPEYGVLNPSEDELLAIGKVEGAIVIDVDKKTNLITVSAELGEPVLVAQMVDRSVELLQEYITKYKTKQARKHLDFVRTQYYDKKSEYEIAQQAFYTYKDKHRNMISERINIKFQHLSDEYEISSSVYKSLAQQLEQAKIAVNEQTPAFTILEPTKIPIEKSAPNKMIILIVSAFLGGLIGLGIVFGKLVWANMKKNF